MSTESIKVEWHGMQELLSELRNLPKAIRERVLIGAVAKAASVLKAEAVLQAPQWTGEVSKGHPPSGTLKRAIYQARLVNECTDTREVRIVSVRSGKKFRAVKVKGGIANQDAFYAYWVEYGHWTRAPGTDAKTHKALRQTGMLAAAGARWVPPNPFMRRAFANKQGEAFQAMRSYVEANLPAAVMASRVLKVIAA